MDTESLPLAVELNRALDLLCDAFAARSVRYALIGGLATILRGRVRFTKDIDFLIDVPQIVLPGLLDDLVEKGFTVELPVVIKQFVQEHVASFPFGPVRIDWLKPVLPLYAHALAGAETLIWSEGHPIQVVTAEGLILTKMVAFRTQDQADIESVLTGNRDKIDIELIRHEWAPFAPLECERTAWLEAAIEKRVIRRE
jgi:hypothetical protein